MNSNNNDDLQSDIDDHRGQNTLLGQKMNFKTLLIRDCDPQQRPTTASHNNVPQRRPTPTSHNDDKQRRPTTTSHTLTKNEITFSPRSILFCTKSLLKAQK